MIARGKWTMRLRAWSLVLFGIVAMLAWGAPADAVDGTIEINQAKVMASGGFPYAISAANTSYRLTGSLTVPASTNGVNVTAANVGIDLNGFSISGPGSTSATPIGVNSAAAGITVKNGTVTGFGVGVQLGSVGIVRNVHADANGIAGISVGDNTVVEGCTANNSTASGGSGIHCGAGCAISGNTANGNNTSGIFCNGDGCAISGNTADLDDIGIDCNGNACAISGNSVANIGGAGIFCNGSGCLVSGNTSYNTSFGILANDATTGYGGNVLNKSFTAPVSGGTSMKNNVCNGTVC
jgi:hypothetical protein